MSKRTELIALLGQPPEQVAIELMTSGIPIEIIADKLEVTRETVMRWTRPARPRLRRPQRDYRVVTPDGSLLKDWLKAHNVTSIDHSHVIRRLNLGWEFFDAVYREIGPRRARR